MEVLTGGLTVTSFDSMDEGPSSSSTQIHQEEQNGLRPEPQMQGYRPFFYHLNVSLIQVVSTNMRDEACAAFIVLFTFWIFACLTVILGFYGSSKLELGPNSSRLLGANPFFVQSIKVKELSESKHKPVLYGFDELPPLDVKLTWSEAHVASLQSGGHREWQYFLNKGSKVHISYLVNRPSGAALSLVIAEGRGDLADWFQDPSYPNTNIIHGNGTIEQEVSSSKTYYIALGNLNFEEVQVQLNFTIEALVYNATHANYKCTLDHQFCSLKLFFVGNAAVLTSPGPEPGMTNYVWHVQLSYGHRWMSYFVGSASMSVLIILATKICFAFGITREYGETGARGTASERAPLISQKDDDLSSCGSYDSLSHDEEELNGSLTVATLDRKQLKEGESNKDHRRLCILCSDAFRDCFFLPCGHFAACFTCGTRVIEEAGNCPVCHRTMKKVRKIFSV